MFHLAFNKSKVSKANDVGVGGGSSKATKIIKALPITSDLSTKVPKAPKLPAPSNLLLFLAL